MNAACSHCWPPLLPPSPFLQQCHREIVQTPYFCISRALLYHQAMFFSSLANIPGSSELEHNPQPGDEVWRAGLCWYQAVRVIQIMGGGRRGEPRLLMLSQLCPLEDHTPEVRGLFNPSSPGSSVPISLLTPKYMNIVICVSKKAGAQSLQN